VAIGQGHLEVKVKLHKVTDKALNRMYESDSNLSLSGKNKWHR